MNQNILKTLLIYNPWIKNINTWADSIAEHMPQAFGYQYVPRFGDTSEHWPHNRKINLVIGPRQCGKSTLIWHTISEMGPNVLYINANELSLREWCTSPAIVSKEIRDIIDHPTALFFEEIQYIENAGLFLKGLADLHLNIPIFATGSSSFHLHDMMRESLAGRANRLTLYPFSLNEWPEKKDSLSQTIYMNEINESLLRFLVFGSYPEVCFSYQPDLVLNQLVEAFIIRDASDTFRIKFIAKFRMLLALMASQIGNLVNYSALASSTGLDVKTLENYAHILEEAHIIKLLPPFVGGKRAEITSAPKIYFIDNGIRNLMVHQFNDFDIRADKGALYENWLFSELLKHSAFDDMLFYWRSKGGAEVDFIRQQGDVLQAFEAKAGALNQPKLSRSSRSFIDAYQPNIVFVVNQSLSTEDTIGNTRVQWITPFELLQFLKTGVT